ncbi:16774_t:CDS:2 [Acaulospora morrowiae]|uniref:16774_t:CDS:1 n=1 Tax=Acaulospora morrowiae TaxID=94023 RepID=A0A9N8VQT7_9GLOM|nr:16774_t:CDS:2 [Acaulospora morrowiae]
MITTITPSPMNISSLLCRQPLHITELLQNHSDPRLSFLKDDEKKQETRRVDISDFENEYNEKQSDEEKKKYLGQKELELFLNKDQDMHEILGDFIYILPIDLDQYKLKSTSEKKKNHSVTSEEYKNFKEYICEILGIVAPNNA